MIIIRKKTHVHYIIQVVLPFEELLFVAPNSKIDKTTLVNRDPTHTLSNLTESYTHFTDRPFPSETLRGVLPCRVTRLLTLFKNLRPTRSLLRDTSGTTVVDDRCTGIIELQGCRYRYFMA